MLLRHKLNFFIALTGLLTALLSYGVSVWVLDNFLAKKNSDQTQALTSSIQQDIEVFDRLLLLAEEKWESELKTSLPALAKELFELSLDNNDISIAVLEALKSKYNLSDLHLIDKDMTVFASTFESEIGLDMNAYGNDYVKNIQGVLNQDLFFTHRVSLSTITGNLKKYAYFSQKGSDIVINGDIDLKERLLSENKNEVADYLFGDYVKKLVAKYKTISRIDLFILSPVDQWSLFNPGVRIEEDKARSLFNGTYRQAEQSKSIIQHVDLQSYRRVGFKAFLQIDFDDSLLAETKTNLRIFLLVSATLIVLISFFIIHIITKKLILNRFGHLLSQIQEKHSDQDDAIHLAGNDELSRLGSEINKLMERIKIEKDTNKWLTGISEKDSLTDLGNRRWFDQKLESEWALAKANGDDFSIAMIDVDCFKNYNDEYGHIEGDQCLQSIASALLKIVNSESGHIARYGGEEFVCILPKTNMADAKHIMESMQASIKALNIMHESSDVASYVTLSLGCFSASGRNNIEASEILKRADLLLYQSKRNGKNCITQDELI
ncbi:diguanylate cyclase domain-containing protein [Glaciecola sp. SC05]|uniref:diguanylate cyclase domain-containing protein n=1 Tax=Glaciecola sp. SC05 TaxID=1987355 RepID=UPI00352753F1